MLVCMSEIACVCLCMCVCVLKHQRTGSLQVEYCDSSAGFHWLFNSCKSQRLTSYGCTFSEIQMAEAKLCPSTRIIIIMKIASQNREQLPVLNKKEKKEDIMWPLVVQLCNISSCKDLSVHLMVCTYGLIISVRSEQNHLQKSEKTAKLKNAVLFQTVGFVESVKEEMRRIF